LQSVVSSMTPPAVRPNTEIVLQWTRRATPARAQDSTIACAATTAASVAATCA